MLDSPWCLLNYIIIHERESTSLRVVQFNTCAIKLYFIHCYMRLHEARHEIINKSTDAWMEASTPQAATPLGGPLAGQVVVQASLIDPIITIKHGVIV